MPTLMDRLLLRFSPVVLLLCFVFAVCGVRETFAENPRENPKGAIAAVKDTGKAEAGVVEDEDADFVEDEEADENAATVEVDLSASPEENISPLINRDYLRQFDIPIVFNEAVDYFVRYFTVQKRKVFINWLKRAKLYAPMIRQILREQGLPEDLVYLAMIESGFNPKAYSPMKACGPWQFIYETGERYGLRVNYWVDERRDPQKSTVAAARYLKDLFNQFGCWYLAAAGYNAGEKRIERAIIKHETNDFWELRKFNTLPRETREYIPQLIAAAIIAKDPERFGLTNIPFQAPITSEARSVPGGTPLTLISKAARADLVTVHSLNPELLRGITPPDRESYAVRLPRAVNGGEFDARLKAALEDGSRVLGVTAHTVKRRESVAAITRRYGISEGDLMLVNACGEAFSVRPGTLVYIPRFQRDGDRPILVQTPKVEEIEKKAVVESPPVITAAAGKSFHVVKRGEKLHQIARRYGMDVGTIKEINNLKSDRVRPNTRIILVKATNKVGEKQTREESRKAVSPGRIFHVVKKGESLTDISEKYGTDVATLKKINNLKRDQIVPRMRLEVSEGPKAQQATGEKKVQAKADGTRRGGDSAKGAVGPKRYHIVKKGENLNDISEKYKMKVTSLKKLNNLKKDGVRPGMRLKIAYADR